MMPLYSSGPWVPSPCQPPIHPLIPPNGPYPLGAPNAPDAPYTPSGPWVPTVTTSPPIHAWHPYTPDDPKWPPHWFPGGVTYLIKTRQVTQMSYAALYKHVALFAVTIYKYVHTSPNHIFLHQIYKNAMRTISTPDQFTHILPSTI